MLCHGVPRADLPGRSWERKSARSEPLGEQPAVCQQPLHAQGTEAFMFLEKLRLYSVGDELVNKAAHDPQIGQREVRTHTQVPCKRSVCNGSTGSAR